MISVKLLMCAGHTANAQDVIVKSEPDGFCELNLFMAEILNVYVNVPNVLKLIPASTFKAPLSHTRLKCTSSSDQRLICTLLWNGIPTTIRHTNSMFRAS